MSAVLDASAMVAFFRREEGYDQVRDVLEKQSCCAHSINVCEVYYDVYRTDGEGRAAKTIADLGAMGVVFREDMDIDFWRVAGKIKAEHVRVSLADCFCIALANRLGLEVCTADHHGFDPIAKKKLCRVRFIR